MRLAGLCVVVIINMLINKLLLKMINMVIDLAFQGPLNVT